MMKIKENSKKRKLAGQTPKKREKKKKKTSGTCEEIICAGFGGQGIMFMGKLLAQAGLLDALQVSWMPSYGAEVRGGTAHSMIKICPGAIPSPTIAKPSICVVMNRPSLEKFVEKLRDGGVLIINKTLIDAKPNRKEIDIVCLPVTDIAVKLGNVRVANMVAIGALVKKTRLFSIKTIFSALAILLKGKGEETFSLNKKAFEAGYRSVYS